MMPVLTEHQKRFLARLAIVEVLEEYETEDGDELGSLDIQRGGEGGIPDEELVALGIDQDILDGYRLALEDLEKARDVMEENAAFPFLLSRMKSEHPGTSRAQLQKAVRALVADPVARREAAEASGLYERLEAGA